MTVVTVNSPRITQADSTALMCCPNVVDSKLLCQFVIGHPGSFVLFPDAHWHHGIGRHLATPHLSSGGRRQLGGK